MCPLAVIVCQPGIQIVLQFVEREVQLAAERDLVELLQNRLVEPLANAVGLRMACLGFGVPDVVECQVQLVIMRFRFAAVFGSPVGQHAQDAHAVFGKERQNPIVQQIGGGNRRLGGIQLGKRHLAVGVDKRLLVNAADTLEGADVERIL